MSERKVSLMTNVLFILIAFLRPGSHSVSQAARGNGQLAVRDGRRCIFSRVLFVPDRNDTCLTVIAVAHGNLMTALSAIPDGPLGVSHRRIVRGSHNFRRRCSRASDRIRQTCSLW